MYLTITQIEENFKTNHFYVYRGKICFPKGNKILLRVVSCVLLVDFIVILSPMRWCWAKFCFSNKVLLGNCKVILLHDCPYLMVKSILRSHTESQQDLKIFYILNLMIPFLVNIEIFFNLDLLYYLLQNSKTI